MKEKSLCILTMHFPRQKIDIFTTHILVPIAPPWCLRTGPLELPPRYGCTVATPWLTTFSCSKPTNQTREEILIFATFTSGHRSVVILILELTNLPLLQFQGFIFFVFWRCGRPPQHASVAMGKDPAAPFRGNTPPLTSRWVPPVSSFSRL